MPNPREFDFRKKLESALKEGADTSLLDNFDIDSFKKVVDEEYVNSIAKYRSDKAREKAGEEMRPELEKEILKGLGIEGDSVEAAKAWAKRLQANTTEKDEIISKYEGRIKELEPLQSELEKNKQLVHKYETMSKFNDVKPEYREDVYDLASKKANEETPIEEVVKSMKETHKSFFTTPHQGAGGKVNPDDQDDGKTLDDEEKEWEKEFL